ncbi:MAG: hypothetical protein ABSG46_09250 [Candidatus Binataceae bacterium]|jgi:hypothetical protein
MNAEVAGAAASAGLAAATATNKPSIKAISQALFRPNAGSIPFSFALASKLWPTSLVE